MKFIYLLWLVFVINLVTAIVLVNTLSFKTPGESTGFLISIILLYFVVYGVLVLFTYFVLTIIRRQESKQQTNTSSFPVKFVLHLIPLLAFYAAFHIMIFVLPKAISTGDYMKLNGISMALGLTLGGARSLYMIRK